MDRREAIARELARFTLLRGVDHWRLYRDEERIDGPWTDREVDLAWRTLREAQADAVLALPAEPLGDDRDGGWAYVQRLFGETVRVLRVPGRSPDGKQDIIISFKDGSTVHVAADSLDEAWTMVAEAAEAICTSPHVPSGGK